MPNNVLALKSQQRRWAKGSMETAIKLIPHILRSPRLNRVQKLEAVLHLTHYMVSVFMCMVCVLTMPMLIWTPTPRIFWVLAIIWSLILVSALAPCVMYTLSGRVFGRGLFSLTRFPAMLVVGTGLCLNNAKAVFDAIRGIRTEFVRTPKSGSAADDSRTITYSISRSTWLGIIELLMGIYCWSTLYVYFGVGKYLFGFFLVAYALGFCSFGLLSVRPACIRRSTESVDELDAIEVESSTPTAANAR